MFHLLSYLYNLNNPLKYELAKEEANKNSGNEKSRNFILFRVKKVKRKLISFKFLSFAPGVFLFFSSYKLKRLFI